MRGFPVTFEKPRFDADFITAVTAASENIHRSQVFTARKFLLLREGSPT